MFSLNGQKNKHKTECPVSTVAAQPLPENIWMKRKKMISKEGLPRRVTCSELFDW